MQDLQLVVIALFILVTGYLVVTGQRKSTNAIEVLHETVTKVVAEVAAVHKDSAEINNAVNHKDHGMPTLVQRVVDQDSRGMQLADDLATATEWQQEALTAIAKPLDVELPPIPPAVPPVEVAI